MTRSGAGAKRTVPLTLQGMGLPVRQIERLTEIGRTSSRNVRHPLLGDIDDVIPVLRHPASLLRHCFSLTAHQFHSETDQSRQAGGLKAAFHRRQLARDLDMLRALLNAGSAPDAIAREASIARHGPRCRDVLVHTLVPAMSERSVIGGEAHGDVDSFGARHAVPAPRARNPVVLRDMLTSLLDRGLLSSFE